MICVYCGRVAHRCRCAQPDSPLRRFLARGDAEYMPRWRDQPYKRGVPPQIKQRERATLRRAYVGWYDELVARYGEHCLHCGQADALVIDHVLPVARGGLSQPDNLQLLCRTCNALKGKLYYDCR